MEKRESQAQNDDKALSTTVFFIVEGRRLELQAMWLATTLWHHNGDRYRYVAYCPKEKICELAPVTRKVLDLCSVELRPLPTAEAPYSPAFLSHYPQGNKIFAATEHRDTDISVFLDTDMVCCEPLDLETMVPEKSVTVSISDYATWKGDKYWPDAYKHFGLPVTEERVKLLRGRKLISFPYFNGGFVAFREADLVDGRNFGELWLDTASRFENEANLQPTRPTLDQISLPLAMQRFGFSHNIMSPNYNLNTMNRVYDPSFSPKIIHYHKQKFIPVWPQSHIAFEVCKKVVGLETLREIHETFKL